VASAFSRRIAFRIRSFIECRFGARAGRDRSRRCAARSG
jgi:hypothetical protein